MTTQTPSRLWKPILLIFRLSLFALTGWGALAIYYSYLPETVRTVLAALFVLCAAGALTFIRSRGLAYGIFLFLFGIVLAGWFSMKPSNHRDWQPDVARLAWADIQGDRITVHNIRHCDYRSEDDYTIGYYDRTVELSRLTSVDLYLVDWGLTHLVHTMLSFGFGDGEYICISIETRKEKHEDYSTVRGLFRQYELYYVVADERDVVRLRTNYRAGETTYLYRIKNVSLDVGRKIFLDYLKTMNRLKEKPEWYNALTGNCTTEIRGHTRPYTRGSWNWRILANGYIDELLYERGVLDRSLPFKTLKEMSIINLRARAADQDPAFSERIRAGLPGFGTLSAAWPAPVPGSPTSRTILLERARQ